MLRDLREELPDERRVRKAAVSDFCLIVEIATRYLPRCPDAVVDVALHAPDPRAPEILALLRDVGADLRQRDVRHRVADAVVVPGRPDVEIPQRRKADAGLAADEPLGPELIVREREHGADAELPIELIERRRPEARSE